MLVDWSIGFEDIRNDNRFHLFFGGCSKYLCFRKFEDVESKLGKVKERIF